MSVVVERETGGKPCPHTLAFLFPACFASQLLLCAQSFHAGHLIINQKVTAGVKGHGDSEHVILCNRLPKGLTPSSSSAPRSAVAKPQANGLGWPEKRRARGGSHCHRTDHSVT